VNNEPGNDYSLRDLLKTLDRRRNVLLGTAAVVFLLAVLACIVMTRRYEAKAVFELQKSSSDSLDLEDMMGAATGGATDSLSVNTDLETEASILESDTLALQVIEELDLENNKDFVPRFNPINWVIGLITPPGPKDPVGASLENSPHRRDRLLKTFSRHLTVTVDAGTRLIEVEFSNRDPKVAAAVVNHLIEALIEYTFETKYVATTQVSNWLDGQLDDFRKQNEELQAQVVKLQEKSGIFGVGGTDLEGKPVVYSPILDRLQESSALLSQAKMSVVIKGAVYQVAKTGDAELLSQLAGTSLSGETSQGVMDSLTLIQDLRTQEATLQAQIGQDASQFGPAYPKLIEERASLRSVDASLRAEIARVAARAKNDYDIALATQKGAEANYDADRSAAEKLNDKTIEYTILSKEAEESDDLYQDLLRRLKEAGILEDLHSSNMTFVDKALPPAKPNHPNVPLLLGLGLLGGLFLGAIAAALTDAVDNKIRGTEEIENMGLPLLGVVPLFSAADLSEKIIAVDSRSSAFNEAIRALRSALLIARSGKPPQVLLVTSGSPTEGKSTLALNLAAAFAHYKKKVLLLEADMRRPVLKKRLRLETTGGLSTLLADQSESVGPEMIPDHPDLYIMPAGPTPPYPSELLGAAPLESILTHWCQEFDFVVIDAPPILPVTDGQILIAHADATILIARAGKTSRVGLQRAYKLLLPHAKDPAQPAIGVLLNGISSRSAAYYGYYGNYGYTNYYHSGGGKND